MESNDGDNIVLNLTTKCSEQLNAGEIKKVKFCAENYFAKKPKTRNAKKSIQPSRKSQNFDIHENKALGNKNTEKFQVISSLFRKNPELPHISRDVLEPVDKKEDETFSEREFKNMKLAPFMISNLEKNLHLKKMTSIQKASLPSLLSGKDVFIQSPTGTGKTLSYVIPVVQTLQAILPKIQRADGTYCLILVPTRELASQTLTVVQQIVKPFIWIVPGSVTGGEKRKSEKARLRKGVNILVATPGRLVDHLKTTKCLTMTHLRWLILDEADRLLDLGFEHDLSFILSTIKEHSSGTVQKVLLSATLSQGVENLLDVSMSDPVTINMTEEGNLPGQQVEYQTPNLLEQFCVVVPMKLRLVTLAAYLEQNFQKNCKIIVFFTTQDSVDFHFALYSSTLRTVEGEKLKLMRLHGKLSQNERAEVFSNFKDSDEGILLCTDVASRGLDLPSVDWIVQYNPPVSSADYVHRVGRTARIGLSGKAVLFLLPTEVPYLNILSEQNLRLVELKMNDIHSTFVRSRRVKQAISEAYLQDLITEQHMKFEDIVWKNSSLKQLAVTAFRSFIGAYNTFPSSLKHIFHPCKLHLGHLAKSFALRETPSELKPKSLKEARKPVDRSKIKRSRRVNEQSCNISGVVEPYTKRLKKR